MDRGDPLWHLQREHRSYLAHNIKGRGQGKDCVAVREFTTRERRTYKRAVTAGKLDVLVGVHLGSLKERFRFFWTLL